MLNFLEEKNNRLIVALLVLMIFAVFGNALFNGFVYDDNYLIVHNSYLRDFSSLDKILLDDVTKATPYERASGYYRPVSMFYLLLSYQIWNVNAWGYHLFNIFIHCANALLVLLIIQMITQRKSMAMFAAYLFAVHPIHVEAVTPIYNFMGLLSSFFSLVAFYFFMTSEQLKRSKFICCSLIALFLGVFSKEEAFILPVIFLMYDYFFWAQGKISVLLKRMKYYVACFGVIGFYVLMRIFFIEKEAALGLWNVDIAFNMTAAANPLLGGLTVLKIYSLYIIKLVMPLNLSAFYFLTPVQSMASFDALVAICFISALSWLIMHHWRKNPLVSFFCVFFLISTIPFSNIIPIGGLFSDRFMYFPSIGYCALLGYCLITLKDYLVNNNYLILGRCIRMGGIVIVLLYATQTIIRNYAWRGDIALWRDTVKKVPGHQFPHLQLATALYANQDYGSALEEYKIALRMSHFKEFYVRNVIGKLYGILGQYDQAIKELTFAVNMNSQYVETYYNLGMSYFMKKNSKKAKDLFEQSLQIDADYPWSYYGLGLIYEQRGERAQARKMFQKALTINPRFLNAREALKKYQNHDTVP